MRVIAGTARSLKLKTIEGLDTRPTTDRIKETLFNMLNPYVQGALWGVGIAVIALILLTVREMWNKSTRNAFFYVVFILALSGLLLFNLTPVQTILIYTVFGVLYKIMTTPKEAR